MLLCMIKFPCKSINKKLRSFLQAQVNYSKVKPEDIKKIYKRLPEKDRKKVYDIINGY